MESDARFTPLDVRIEDFISSLTRSVSMAPPLKYPEIQGIMEEIFIYLVCDAQNKATYVIVIVV